MPSPPPWLEWIAVAGGIVAILKGFVELFGHWRNRARVVFRMLSAVTYYDTWTEADVEGYEPSPFWSYPPFKAGEYRWLFTVLEFSLENHHSQAVSAGRILINDWIYSSRFLSIDIGRRVQYKHKDYRVFDLHSRESATLEEYWHLEPGDSVGLRVEVFEEAA